MSKSRRFCFTLNNPTDDECQALVDFLDGDRCVYGVFGRETGAEGTPHLQGFLILPTPQRFSFLHRAISPRLHLETTRGTSQQASDYCKKDGDYEEFGVFPASQGKRTDIEAFTTWVKEQSTSPSEREVARQFPSLYLRYRSSLLDLVEHLRPEPEFGSGGSLREWQRLLVDRLEEAPDDRSVMFYVDESGGMGKSYFVRYCFTKFAGQVQALSVGKRDDLTFAVDTTKSIFIFDIPRLHMEYLQYSVLEKLKDQILFSAKYASRTKFLPNPVHVVVFCNEFPNMEALTEDRFDITTL
ncbi:rep protein [Naiadivirus vacaense]|uniref:Rep protein n=1 Tax=Circoviridae sp. TaxID=1954248 RepID=A0ABY4CHE0_9VIRU|nr:rep protein [Circoviridae sp.]